MKLAQLKQFLSACLLSGVEFPRDSRITFEVEDYFQEVPDEYHKSSDLEFNHQEGDSMASVTIVPKLPRVGGVVIDTNLVGSKSLQMVTQERARQVEVLGYDDENDSSYEDDVLARAAATYLMRPLFSDVDYAKGTGKGVPYMFPFPEEYWKPHPENRLRELTKAGALVLAEMHRLINKQQ